MKILPQGCYVWADWKKLHKQGKVLHAISPIQIGSYQGMIEIKAIPQSDLDRPLLPEYPNFYVDQNDLVEAPAPIPTPAPTPTPVPAEITDEQAAQALVAIIKFMKQ